MHCSAKLFQLDYQSWKNEIKSSFFTKAKYYESITST